MTPAAHLRWEVDGRDWPNRVHSRFVHAGGLRWHVQVAGSGPALLLLHGAGAATHSWRGLLPLLARRFTVVAPDLPGHGFTATPRDPARSSLPGMTAAVAALLGALALRPVLLAGHSAGTAVAARLSLLRNDRPALVGLNPALQPPEGAASLLFPVAARLLTAAPGAAWLLAARAAMPGVVDRVLAGTGSRVAPEQARLYARLLTSPGHVDGVLRMMSHWDLRSLDLSRLRAPVTLVAGMRDAMVPAANALVLASRIPHARVEMLPGLGHLLHEESPDAAARLIVAAADAVRLAGAAA